MEATANVSFFGFSFVGEEELTIILSTFRLNSRGILWNPLRPAFKKAVPLSIIIVGGCVEAAMIHDDSYRQMPVCKMTQCSVSRYKPHPFLIPIIEHATPCLTR